MTKIAYGSESPQALRQWLEAQGEAAVLRTRYLPKRAGEMDGGSLYWIFAGAFAGRSPLLGFAERDDGRISIRLEPRLIPVEPRPRRGHQGWRYLEAADAPADIGGEAGALLPAGLAVELSRLGLI